MTTERPRGTTTAEDEAADAVRVAFSAPVELAEPDTGEVTRQVAVDAALRHATTLVSQLLACRALSGPECRVTSFTSVFVHARKSLKSVQEWCDLI